MTSTIAECASEMLQVARSIRGHVDGGVEGSPRQRREVVLSITAKTFDAVGEIVRRNAAIEDGDVVSVVPRRPRDGASDERGSANNENFHVNPLVLYPR